ncbi:MAG: hypothetical protein AAGN82_17015, partial [Myxococcota bacterium]
MVGVKRSLVCLCLLGTAGCSGGYDAEADCRETLECCRELDDPLPATLSACTEQSQELYDSFDEETQERADELFDECEGERSCDFLACVAGSQPMDCAAF